LLILKSFQEEVGFMKILGMATLTLSAVLLSACGTTRNSIYGPERPIQAGKIGGYESCTGFEKHKDDSLEAHFRASACASMANADDNTKAKAMFESGARLVHARCNDFFAQKAGTQTGINTAFDSVVPIVSLLTGILSISNVADGRRSDYESALAFGSAAVTSGLKIYESNFLFAAENIESVRKLTVDTLNQHASTFRSELDPETHTFYTSTQYVIENQMICTPGRIRELVSGAIETKKYKFSPRFTSANQTKALAGNKPPPGAPLDQVADK
jgi:hypothetical protein